MVLCNDTITTNIYFICEDPIITNYKGINLPKLNAHIDYLPCVLQVVVNKKEMPHFSFGIRHSQYLAPPALVAPIE